MLGLASTALAPRIGYRPAFSDCEAYHGQQIFPPYPECGGCGIVMAWWNASQSEPGSNWSVIGQRRP